MVPNDLTLRIVNFDKFPLVVDKRATILFCQTLFRRHSVAIPLSMSSTVPRRRSVWPRSLITCDAISKSSLERFSVAWDNWHGTRSIQFAPFVPD